MIVLDGNKSIYGGFLWVLTPFFKVFIFIREYANEIIYISDRRKKGKRLSLNMVPNLEL